MSNGEGKKWWYKDSRIWAGRTVVDAIETWRLSSEFERPSKKISNTHLSRAVARCWSVAHPQSCIPSNCKPRSWRQKRIPSMASSVNLNSRITGVFCDMKTRTGSHTSMVMHNAFNPSAILVSVQYVVAVRTWCQQPKFYRQRRKMFLTMNDTPFECTEL